MELTKELPDGVPNLSPVMRFGAPSIRKDKLSASLFMECENVWTKKGRACYQSNYEPILCPLFGIESVILTAGYQKIVFW